MVDLADKEDTRRDSGKVFEGHLELQFSVFEDAEADEEHSMPN